MAIRFLFLSLMIVSSFAISCSYEKTSIEIRSLFDPTWDFSESSKLNFDNNYVEVKSGQVQLKPLDLKHEGDDFNSGSHVGTYYQSTSGLTNMVEKTHDSLNLKEILPSKTPSLVGYYRMENSWDDDSGNGNHGSEDGGDANFSSSSKVGDYAGLFNADSVNIGNIVNVATGSKYAVTGWFKASIIDGSFRRVFDNTLADGGDGKVSLVGWSLQIIAFVVNSLTMEQL